MHFHYLNKKDFNIVCDITLLVIQVILYIPLYLGNGSTRNHQNEVIRFIMYVKLIQDPKYKTREE